MEKIPQSLLYDKDKNELTLQGALLMILLITNFFKTGFPDPDSFGEKFKDCIDFGK